MSIEKRIWLALLICIVAGIVIHIWYTEASKPIVYIAEASEAVEVKKRDIGIIVKIDWTPERVEREIREVFPEVADVMVEVARCESGLKPTAKGPTNDHGIFQLHLPSHGHRIEALGIDVDDPAENIRFARTLYDERGLRPWSASKHCWSI